MRCFTQLHSSLGPFTKRKKEWPLHERYQTPLLVVGEVAKPRPPEQVKDY